MLNIIRKSILSSILLSVGVASYLLLGKYIGSILFIFGLLSICYLKGYLFTGLCGFSLEDNNLKISIWFILFFNLLGGLCCGIIIGIVDETLRNTAYYSVIKWTLDGYVLAFIKSFGCGIVMYVAVKIYKCGSNLGIIIGVPLFILSGLYHSIASTIMFGMAFLPTQVIPYILIMIVGNYVGSITTWYLTTNTN